MRKKTLKMNPKAPLTRDDAKEVEEAEEEEEVKRRRWRAKE